MDYYGETCPFARYGICYLLSVIYGVDTPPLVGTPVSSLLGLVSRDD